MSLKPLLILFLSTGNAARSIMAEALLNGKGSGRFMARSAGCAPLAGVHPETLSLLRDAGYETESLHTKAANEFMVSAHIVKVDVIVTLSEEARQHGLKWPGDPVRVHWAVDNPLGAQREDMREWKFRKLLATLEARINALVRGRAPQNSGELLLQLKDIGMVV